MSSAAAIRRLFAMTLGANAAYRADILIWALAEFALPLVALGVWYTVSQQGGLGIPPRETFTYFIIIMIVRSATNTWVGFFLAREILNGTIVQYLVRPLSVFWEHVADNLTVKIFRLSLPVAAVVLMIAFAPGLFSPQIFMTTNLILFAASLMLAAVLAFVFDAIFAMLAFWIEDSFEIVRLQRIFYVIATGVLIPYAVMPTWLFIGLKWLPFRYMVSAPVEILLGTLRGASVTSTFAIQLAWIGVSIILVMLLWRAGLKRYAVPGQ